MANFTYLMMAVVQMFLPEPPVSPMTTIFPLALVVLISMVKQVSFAQFYIMTSFHTLDLSLVCNSQFMRYGKTHQLMLGLISEFFGIEFDQGSNLA